MNIVVSSCLAGCDCKYNGGNNFNKKVSVLLDKHTVVCVCPEQLGGLKTPRPPAEIKGDKVISKNGEDVTENFMLGAKIALNEAKRYNCTVAVLKANSPSCGCGKVYDGTFSKTLKNGNGVFAQLLLDNNIKVFTEEDDFDF